MKIKVTTKGITLDVDMSVAELIELAKEFDKEEVVDNTTTLGEAMMESYGFGVQQYDIGEVGNYKVFEVYLGFKIYETTGGLGTVYYRWSKGPNFEDRSNLEEDLDSVKMNINHYVKSKLKS